MSNYEVVVNSFNTSDNSPRSVERFVVAAHGIAHVADIIRDLFLRGCAIGVTYQIKSITLIEQLEITKREFKTGDRVVRIIEDGEGTRYATHEHLVTRVRDNTCRLTDCPLEFDVSTGIETFVSIEGYTTYIVKVVD